MAALTNRFFLLLSLWAADLSHLCDAELVLWDCCCSADVDSPPGASWPMMKEPVLPSTLTMEDVCVCVCMYVYHQWLRRQAHLVGMCVSGILETPLS